ncbi:MAG: M23 family metallopeptidase [Actinobacteria bacterium]|nr:MAG: M23 family metallopeptidase [Actinomycetota bacterium]
MKEHKSVEYYQRRRLELKKKRKKAQVKKSTAILIIAGIVALIIPTLLLGKKAVKTITAAKQAATKPKANELVKFATVGKTPLYLPFDKKYLRILGYHQACNPRSVAMVPVGTHVYKEQTLKFGALKLSDNWNKLIYIEMPRGDSRGGAKNTAIDVAAPHGTTVFAPTNGTIVKIRPYKLYGLYDDYEVHILPDGYKDRHVVLIHIDVLEITTGDRVIATKTKIGKIRYLSKFFREQISDFINKPGDHVHIQTNKLDEKGSATLNLNE